MHEIILNSFKQKQLQQTLINFEKPQNFLKSSKPSKHEMHEEREIRSLPSEKNLEKA